MNKTHEYMLNEYNKSYNWNKFTNSHNNLTIPIANKSCVHKRKPLFRTMSYLSRYKFVEKLFANILTPIVETLQFTCKSSEKNIIDELISLLYAAFNFP